MAIGVLTYQAGDSRVHRCDARLKIAVVLAISIGIFFVKSWWAMALFALVVALAAALVLPSVDLEVQTT